MFHLYLQFSCVDFWVLLIFTLRLLVEMEGYFSKIKLTVWLVSDSTAIRSGSASTGHRGNVCFTWHRERTSSETATRAEDVKTIEKLIRL